jgi:ABC-type nitrate/sulfonate/bicarbonate transport system substrate-binding protein
MKKVCVKYLCLFIVMGVAVSGYSAEPLQPLTVQLNWIQNVQFAGILLAKEKGWYKDAGIDLTIKERQKGIAVIDEVVSGKAQIGIIASADIIKSRTQGTTVKAIAVQLQKAPHCLISMKNKGIDTPDKLKGKKIGIRSEAGEFMVKIVLANQGLKFEDITPVRVGWDNQPLIDGTVDVIQGYMNDEPNALKRLGYDVVYIPAFNYGCDFYGDVYFTTEKLINENFGLIRNFLDVTFRGWNEAFKNPEDAAQLVVEKYCPKVTVDQQTDSLKVFRHLSTLGEGKKYLGWMDEQYWQKGIDILYNFKQIDKKIPANEVFTMDFLNAVYFGKKQ